MFLALALHAACATQIIGPGGLLGPQPPVLTVGLEGEARVPLNGALPWQYGAGVEKYLNDDEKIGFLELRKKHMGLRIGALSTATVGTAIMALGFFLTPAFVNVEHSSLSGLVGPIAIEVVGLVVALTAIPLVVFAPGEYELETVVHQHNSNVKEGPKLMLLEERIDVVSRPAIP